MISCRTLGPLVLKVDGDEPARPLTWKKKQALLLYLAYAPRHTRSREHLMSTLWPDAQKPAAALNEDKYVLKRHGGIVIAEEGGQLRLDASTVELDTTQLEQLTREKKWSEAAALVEGEFLEGFTVSNTSGFEEWLEAEREKWRAKCTDVLVRAAQELLDRGAPERAEDLAARARHLSVHSDAAMRVYLLALALQDRIDEARAVGEVFVKRLKEVLGKDPEPATSAIFHGLPKPKPGTAAKPRPPLLGCGSQLQQVIAVWNQARAGEPGVALVFGDEGMGKSRFAQEVMDRARLDGAVVAISRAVPGDMSHPRIGLKTLAERELLEARGSAGASPAAVGAMGAESGLWAEKFPVKASAEPLPFLQALTEVIRVIAAESPVLLVVDDAQWTDADSIEGLIGILRSLAKNRVMVLVTVSSDPSRPEIDQIRGRVGRDLSGVSVTLEPLGHEDLVAFAHWALPDYNDDQLDRIARRVGTESGGFPLIAYVILTAVADGMRLGEIKEPWPKSKRTYLDQLPVNLADNLVGALNVRFGRLTADAQAVLRVLAVLEGPCPTKVLGRGSDLPLQRVEKAVDELEGRQWVLADARGYSFRALTFRTIVRKRQVLEGEALRIQERVIGT